VRYCFTQLHFFFGSAGLSLFSSSGYFLVAIVKMSYAHLHSREHLDTAYNPGGSHRRSQSEHSSQRLRTEEFGDDIALLDREKITTEELYDPHTRSGRPSFTHSMPSSPNLNPHITVRSPSPDPLSLNLPKGSGVAVPHRSIRSGPSKWMKFLARFRFLLVVAGLVLSIVIIGLNASILSTYNANRNAGRKIQKVGGQEEFWSAWPTEGIDLRPVTSYIGVAVYNTIIMAVFFVSSAHTSFRYLASGWGRLSFVVFGCTVSMVLWVLLSALLQFQAVANNGKHSFR
jgi:hypothetical protein